MKFVDNKEATYLLFYFFGIAMALVLATSIFYLTLGNWTEGGQWTNELIMKKKAAIQRFNPDIVIVAGSNALLGFSAKQISEQAGVPAVNLGVHAGLGISYMLNICTKYLRAGRTFILPLEYEQYAGSDSPALLYQVTGYDPDYLKRIGWIERVRFIRDISLMDRLMTLRLKYIPRSPQNNRYQPQTQNEYGDETINTLINRTDRDVENVLYSKPSKFSHSTKVWRNIEEFVLAARAKGADVVLAYPNIFEGVLDMKANQTFFDELNNRAKTINLTVVGKPEAYTFGKEFIFDTTYHLTSSGRAVATDRLLADLKAAGVIKP